MLLVLGSSSTTFSRWQRCLLNQKEGIISQISTRLATTALTSRESDYDFRGTTKMVVTAFTTTTTNTSPSFSYRNHGRLFTSNKAISSHKNRFGIVNHKNQRLFSTTKEVDATENETTTAIPTPTGEEEGTTTENNHNNKRLSKGTIDGLDLKVVVEHLDIVLSHLTSRHASDDVIQSAKDINELNNQRVQLIKQRDLYLSKRKKESDIVGTIMKQTKGGKDASEEQIKQLKEAKQNSNDAAKEADIAETKLSDIETIMNNKLAGIPNILDDIVPEGLDDSENELVDTWGNIQDLQTQLNWTNDFIPKWHDEIATNLNGWMSEEAVKISGTRFVALSGNIARLERALSQFFIDLHISNGYIEVNVPYVVSRTALEGTSQLPKFENDLFKITPQSHTCNGEDAFLIPTAEVPLTNLYRDTIIDDESVLPLNFVSLTPCFRAEAGSAGRDTRGLVRTHQFHKVELVKITTPQTSSEEHEILTTHAEECLKKLKLPYRKVRLCSGDIGFSAKHCYDLEVWLPGQNLYREISSCSNTGDFQAKRMNLRYRPSSSSTSSEPSTEDTGGKKGNNNKKKPKKVKPIHCHTINGSGLAVGRALVAVLENYQTPEGNVIVPDVLQPYMGGLKILEGKKKL